MTAATHSSPNDDTPVGAEPAAASPSAAPPVTRHRVRSQRVVVVHRPTERGDADPDQIAHALHQVELNGQRTHLISNDVAQRDFEVAVVHPAKPALPRWAAWLGATRGAPVLVWAAEVPAPTPQAFLAGLHRPRLAALGMALLLLAGLGWLHLPDPTPGEVLASRYGLTGGVLLLLVAWHEVVRHLGRRPVDLATVHDLFQYPLHAAPERFETASSPQITLGDKLLRVVRGQVSEVTHWLHPGPMHPGARPSPQLRLRFRMDGRRFEGRTAYQGTFSHPFIVPGDEVRVAVQPSGDGGWRVVALANLSDGHLMFDEADERLQPVSGAVRTALNLLSMGVAGFLVIWLGIGPAADDVSGVLFTTCASLAGWIGATVLWKRQRRNQLAVALGAAPGEQARRRVAVVPLSAV